MASTEMYRVTLRVIKSITIRGVQNITEALEAAENNEAMADLVSVHVDDIVQLDNKGNIIE